MFLKAKHFENISYLPFWTRFSCLKKRFEVRSTLKVIEDDVLPFGHIDDGLDHAEQQERQDQWSTKKWVEEWGTPY